MKTGPTGERLRRQAPPVCEACAKWDAETKRPWPGFTAENWRAFAIARACLELGALPRPGGIEQQEPETLETLLLVKAVKESAEADRAERAEAAALERMRREMEKARRD